MLRIGIVGAGFMGSAAAELLTSKGYRVYVYNRTREKAEKLCRELGCTVIDSIGELVKHVDMAILWITDSAALLDVVSKIAENSRRFTVVNMSTVSTWASSLAKQILEAKESCYVEAPVLGGPHDIRASKAIVLVGGDEDCVTKCLEVLRVFAKSGELVRVGPIPKAMALKLALNAMFFTVAASFFEALAFAKYYGVEELFKELLSKTFLAGVVDKYWTRTHNPSKEPRFSAYNTAKDLLEYISSSYRAKLPSHMAAAAHQLFTETSLEGMGATDYCDAGKRLLDLVAREKS